MSLPLAPLNASHSCYAVQFATWLKKNLALKPAVARMRKQFPEKRSIPHDQVDNMY